MNMTTFKITIGTSLFLLLFFFSTVSFAQTSSSWTADLTHSNMGFKALHKEVSYTVGAFREFDLAIKTMGSGFSNAEIELSIDASSINTANDSRDKHLREYFETDKYPEITFKAKRITEMGENMYTLTGIFTMHGVSKEIDVLMEHIGTNESRGREIAGLSFTATVNRMDYGVGLDLSSVAPEIQLHADIEIIKN
jgi:polyisoprenoid-binding protein YceI